MFRTIENLTGFRLLASDGEMGRVHDFFLDDQKWRLRYVVVETGTWLNRRRVLLDPRLLGTIDAERREVMVLLTRDQVRRSPDVDTDRPVSRQQEILLAAHYGWPKSDPDEALKAGALGNADEHLRSVREISSYAVRFGTEETGQVRDFVVDDRVWSVLHIVMAFGGWLDSHLRVLPVDSIQSISFAERTVRVAPPQAAPTSWPAFDHGALVNRFESIVYFDYYGRPVKRGSTV